MKAIRLVLLFLVFGHVAYGQTSVNEVRLLLEQSQAVYNDIASYEIHMDYTLFRGKSQDTIKSYVGYMLKDGQRSYNKLEDNEAVQLEDRLIRINRIEKKITISKHRAATGMQSILQMLQLLPHLQSFSICTEEQYTVCELVPPAITSFPFTKAQLFFDTDHTLAKQMLYLPSGVHESERLEIQISKPQIPRVLDVLDPNRYITATKGGEIRPSQPLKDYKIISL